MRIRACCACCDLPLCMQAIQSQIIENLDQFRRKPYLLCRHPVGSCDGWAPPEPCATPPPWQAQLPRAKGFAVLSP